MDCCFTFSEKGDVHYLDILAEKTRFDLTPNSDKL